MAGGGARRRMVSSVIMSTPNVLVILCDQLRADCLSVTGNPDILTPGMDRLARDGVVYENCFCPFPVCTPSRYSLLSGLYVHRHGGRSNHCTLVSPDMAFPARLARRGYRSSAVGKMHFTPTYLDVGFRRMMLAEQDGPGRFDDDYHDYLMDRGLVDTIDIVDQREEFRSMAGPEYWDTFGAVPSELAERDSSTGWIGEEACRELEGWEGGGNLLMVGFIKPHHPFDPPPPWSGMYDPEALTLLEGWTESCAERDLTFNRGYFPHDTLDERSLRRVMAMYYGCVSQIDRYVGKFIEILEARGLYEDTLVVFTGDHGEYLGFHHLLLKGNHGYDPLMRVPLLVKYPGKGGGGKRSPVLCSTVDITATILSRCGESADGLDGLDLTDGTGGRTLVFAESNREIMVRSSRDKLLIGRDSRDTLYFDLEHDPLETTDLSRDPRFAARIEELRSAALDWLMIGTRRQLFLNEGAPIIDAPNARRGGDPLSARSADYFRSRVPHRES